MVKVEADRERCIGAGMCVRTAPLVFDQDREDGRVVLHSDSPKPDDVDAVRAAIDLCPSGALSLRDS